MHLMFLSPKSQFFETEFLPHMIKISSASKQRISFGSFPNLITPIFKRVARASAKGHKTIQVTVGEKKEKKAETRVGQR